VRREVSDHPESAAAIEHECSACHMPATRYAAKIAGGKGQVFAHLPIAMAQTPACAAAADAVWHGATDPRRSWGRLKATAASSWTPAPRSAPASGFRLTRATRG
jgi:hypothetical protein